MADFRTIMPTIWSDRFIESLPISEKLLFIYLFANERTSNIGVTDVSPRKIAFDTGATVDDIENFFSKAEKAGKIVRDGDMVLLVNFIKNQTHMREDSKVSKFLIKNLQKLHGELPSGRVKKALATKYPQFFCAGEAHGRPYPDDSDTHAAPHAEGMDTLSTPPSDGLDTLSIGSAGGSDTLTEGSAYPPREERGKTKEETALEEKKKDKDTPPYPPARGQCVRISSAPMNREDIEEARDAARAERRRGDYEFSLLRQAYDEAKPEGQHSGRDEFLRLFSSPDFPGIDELLESVRLMAAEDDQWRRGFVPSLARYLRERMWTLKPRKPIAGAEAEPEKTETDRAQDEQIARVRAEYKAREAEKKKIMMRGW